jgi:hypothetical protein
MTSFAASCIEYSLILVKLICPNTIRTTDKKTELNISVYIHFPTDAPGVSERPVHGSWVLFTAPTVTPCCECLLIYTIEALPTPL